MFNQDSQGILPVKFDGGVWSASQNLCPIFNQNPRLSLPYLWPDVTFDTLFMAVSADTVAQTWFLEGLVFINKLKHS